MEFLNFQIMRKWGPQRFCINYSDIKYVKCDIGPAFITIAFVDQKVEGFLVSDQDVEVICRSISKKDCDYFTLNDQDVDQESEGEND